MTLFRGKANVTQVMEMGNRAFTMLLKTRSKELENENAREAEAGAQMEEDLDERGGI